MRPAFARPARPRSLAASLSRARLLAPPPTQRVHDRPPSTHRSSIPPSRDHPPRSSRLVVVDPRGVVDPRSGPTTSRDPPPRLQTTMTMAIRSTRRSRRSARIDRDRADRRDRSTRSSSTHRSSRSIVIHRDGPRRSSSITHPRARPRPSRPIDRSIIIHRHRARRRPRRRRRESHARARDRMPSSPLVVHAHHHPRRRPPTPPPAARRRRRRPRSRASIDRRART